MIDHYNLDHICEKHLFFRKMRPDVTCQKWIGHNI